MLPAALDWFFRDRTSGRIVIGQWPNTLLWLFGLMQAVEAQRETVMDRTWRFGRTYRAAILLVLAYIVMRAFVAFTVGW